MTSGFLAGTGLGAALAYLADSESGRRRRALVRDQLIHGSRKLQDAVGIAFRDTSHRAHGALATARNAFRSGKTDDAHLTDRIRARLGRVVRHPSSIDVYVEEGGVILSGPVLKDEVEALLEKVRSVPGVSGVENRLDVHESAEGVPGLQGDPMPPKELAEWQQENWTPALRMAAVAAGGAFLIGGGRVPILGFAVRLAGLALIARGAYNAPFNRLGGRAEETEEVSAAQE